MLDLLLPWYPRQRHHPEGLQECPDDLSARLLRELCYGVTVLPAQSMYSDTPRSLLICAVNRRQIVRFQKILRQFPDAFAYGSGVSGMLDNFKRISI